MKGKYHAGIGFLTYYNYSVISRLHFNIIEGVLSVFFALLPDLDHYNSILSNKIANKTILFLVEGIFTLICFLPILLLNEVKGLNYYVFFIVVCTTIIVINWFFKKTLFKRLTISIVVLLSYLVFHQMFPTKEYIYMFVLIALIPWFSHRTFSHSLCSLLVFFSVMFFSQEGSHLQRMALPYTLVYSSHIFLGDLWTPSGVPLLWPFSTQKYTLIHTSKKSLWTEKIIPWLILSILLLLALFLRVKTT